MPKQDTAYLPNMQMQPKELERKARMDAVWHQMNKGVSLKTLYSIINKPTSASNKTSSKTSSKFSSSWMTVLGLSQKKTSEPVRSTPENCLRTTQNDTSEEAKKVAAAALSAVKEAAKAGASAGQGKVITEVRDFACEEVEIEKYVDATPQKQLIKAKALQHLSAVDIILEHKKEAEAQCT